jgi:hypothetical protein
MIQVLLNVTWVIPMRPPPFAGQNDKTSVEPMSRRPIPLAALTD